MTIVDKKNQNIIVIVSLLLLAVIVQGLFIDVTRDSGKYASIAKEIFTNGNWLNLTIHGEPYLQKPPFMFWLSAISFKIFGISNFSFKFPLFLFSMAGLYFVYRLGKSLYNAKIGIISAVLLLFSEYFLLYNMDIHTDTLLMPLTTFSIWQLSEFIRKNKTRYILGAATGIGLAMLTKGPIGAVIPAFAIGSHLILTKQFKRFFDRRWIILIVTCSIIITPLLWSLYEQFGTEGIKFYFWTNNIGRITGQYLGTNHDYLFFFHTLLYMLLPWSLLFFISTYNEFSRIIKKRIHATEFFTTGGIWIFLIIMSFSRSKLPNYIYALSPLMAIVTAKWIYFSLKSNSVKLNSIFKYSQLATEFVIWTLILATSTFLFPFKNTISLVLLLFIFILYIYFRHRIKIPHYYFVSTAVSMLILTVVLNFHIFPEIYSQQAVPKAARLFNQISEKNDRLYNYKYGQYELYFYGNRSVNNIDNTNELAETIQSGNAWIFTNEKGFGEIKKLPLTTKQDTVFTFRHASLNKGLRYINPKTREKSKETMYLLHYK